MPLQGESVLPGNGRYTHRSRVRFTHTDPAGYVFYPRFFEMFQATIEDWFNCGLGVDYAGLFLNHGLGLPTAHTECTFHRPCRLGELVDFTLLLKKIGRTSITVEFHGSVAGEPRLRAESVLVCIGLKDGQPAAIPGDLRDKFELYREQCAGPGSGGSN